MYKHHLGLKVLRVVAVVLLVLCRIPNLSILPVSQQMGWRWIRWLVAFADVTCRKKFLRDLRDATVVTGRFLRDATVMARFLRDATVVTGRFLRDATVGATYRGVTVVTVMFLIAAK